ncbi:MAG: hypothetical protein J6V44_15765 [Methanobrevibacter sp.]|nr:hypothetical protein [Methanobrevibacter sp.]MBO7692160.1 hypothetical protein [Methanobrevibacter sp.]
MARSKGSLSTDEAKKMCKDLELLLDTSFKYNFNCLRFIELLLCQNICDQLNEANIENTLDVITEIEIPLIGTLKITPRIFHEKHGVTDEPSVHFDFEFKPTSGFKTDVLQAYTYKDSGIGDVFAHLYGDRLKELYKNLQEG